MRALREPLGDLIRSEPVLLVQFGDMSCAPCQAIRQRLDAWLMEHPEMTARYAEISDHLPECAQLGIFSVPVLILYMDGAETVRVSGWFSLESFLKRAERLLSLRADGIA